MKTRHLTIVLLALCVHATGWAQGFGERILFDDSWFFR